MALAFQPNICHASLIGSSKPMNVAAAAVPSLGCRLLKALSELTMVSSDQPAGPWYDCHSPAAAGQGQCQC